MICFGLSRLIESIYNGGSPPNSLVNPNEPHSEAGTFFPSYSYQKSYTTDMILVIQKIPLL